MKLSEVWGGISGAGNCWRGNRVGTVSDEEFSGGEGLMVTVSLFERSYWVKATC